MKTKTKIIIAIATLLIVAGSVWYYFNFWKGKVSVEKADWLKKSVDIEFFGGGKKVSITKESTETKITKGDLGGGYAYRVEATPDRILIFLDKDFEIVRATEVDFKTKQITDVTSTFKL